MFPLSFLNLYNLRDPDFRNHNFSDFCNGWPSQEPLIQVSEVDIETYIRESHAPDPMRPGRVGGFPPDFDPILPFTLSQRCCESFIRSHPQLPITARDYYLSKAFQFLYVALRARYYPEGAEFAAHSAAGEVRDVLQQALDRIPDQQIPKLCAPDLDWWWTVYSDSRQYDLQRLLVRLQARFRRMFRDETRPPRRKTGPDKEQFAGDQARARLALSKVRAVNYKMASVYLGRSPRQIRRLAKYGKLESVGEGRYKQITAASLLRYLGDAPHAAPADSFPAPRK